jgi:very-short-patch-repair endonuclease
MIATARDLRQRMTPAEERLWAVLRNRATLGCRVRRQFAIGTSVIDFFIPSAGLAIELDGSIHDDPAVTAHDRERAAWLEAQGIRVMRFRNDEVLTNLEGVVERIRAALSNPHPPAPSPVATGEGER